MYFKSFLSANHTCVTTSDMYQYKRPIIINCKYTYFIKSKIPNHHRKLVLINYFVDFHLQLSMGGGGHYHKIC